MSRQFKLFVCSYLVTGNLINLELVFPEKPLLSELRARVVNTFRAEESSLIDRGQSMGYDVAAMFVFGGDNTASAKSHHHASSMFSASRGSATSAAATASSGGWRGMTADDIIEGIQVYAQPRLSTSIVRTICDVASEALEFQRIPPPRKPMMTKQVGGAVSPTTPHPMHQELQRQLQTDPFLPAAIKTAATITSTTMSPRGTMTMIMSSDDDDDYNNNNAGDAFEGTTAGSRASDLALAECWEEAVRRLFHELDVDHDGLVNIADLPRIIERIAAGTGEAYRPELFSNSSSSSNSRNNNSVTLVDERSFISFCNEPNNAAIVSGLLAFIHNCNRTRAALEYESQYLRPSAAVRRSPAAAAAGGVMSPGGLMTMHNASSRGALFDRSTAQWHSPLSLYQ